MPRNNPWIAAVLNFFVFGLGYLYLNKKKFFGVLLLIGYVAISIVYNLTPGRLGSYLYVDGIGLGIGFIVIGLALAYDAYQLAKSA